MENHRSTKPFGIIVGLGTPSSLYYYRAIVEACARRGVGADMMLAHGDFDAVLDFIVSKDTAGLAAYFADLIVRLKCSGAQMAALSAVMPHVCMPELTPLSPLKILDIIEVLNQHLAGHDIDRVALLGTRISMESRLFGRLRNVAVCELTEAETSDMGSIYRSIQINGAASDHERSYLRRLCEDLHQNRGAQAVVLAGTDLAEVFGAESESFPVVNTAQLHIDAIVDWATR